MSKADRKIWQRFLLEQSLGLALAMTIFYAFHIGSWDIFDPLYSPLYKKLLQLEKLLGVTRIVDKDWTPVQTSPVQTSQTS